MNHCRFRIRFHDRVGMARDVAAVVATHEANIVSLEVEPGEMYLQFDQAPAAALPEIVGQLGMIPDVLEVTPVRWLPRELNQQRLRGIFDAVEESILITDKHGLITMCNQKAVEVLGLNTSPVTLSLQDAGFPAEIAGASLRSIKATRGAVKNPLRLRALPDQEQCRVRRSW